MKHIRLESAMSQRPDRLILVYDGDSGLRAMLLDVVKKAAGREECPLCEITYGPLGKRRAWVECAARIDLAVDEMHRDELPAEWNVARGDLPCILARVGGDRPFVLLTRAEITACDASIDALDRRIRDALAKLARVVRVEEASP
jgi:hypothetical protein